MEKIVRVSLSAALLEINMGQDLESEGETLLDMESGEFIFLPNLLKDLVEDEEPDDYPSCSSEEFAIARACADEPDRFVHVSSVESWQAYEWRDDFAKLLPAIYQKRILKALDGPGAFARFNDCNNDVSSLSKAWELFEHRQMEEYLNSFAPRDVKIELI